MDYEMLSGLLGTSVYRIDTDNIALYTCTLVGVREFRRRQDRIDEEEVETSRLEVELLSTTGISDWFGVDGIYFNAEDAKARLASIIEDEVAKLVDKGKDWNIDIDTAKLGRVNE